MICLSLISQTLFDTITSIKNECKLKLARKQVFSRLLIHVDRMLVIWNIEKPDYKKSETTSCLPPSPRQWIHYPQKCLEMYGFAWTRITKQRAFSFFIDVKEVLHIYINSTDCVRSHMRYTIKIEMFPLSCMCVCLSVCVCVCARAQQSSLIWIKEFEILDSNELDQTMSHWVCCKYGGCIIGDNCGDNTLMLSLACSSSPMPPLHGNFPCG